MKAFAKGMLSFLMAVSFVVSAAFSQSNPRGTSILTLRGKTLSVEYGRPSLKGRTVDEVLGKLPPGALWQVGADTSTTFKTDVDLAFSNVDPTPDSHWTPSLVIPAGQYSIWMQKQADNSWKLLFDKQHGQSGEPVPNASECFASVPLFISKPHDLILREMVTIELDSTKDDRGGGIDILWGTLEARVFFAPK
jgi:hypothetical protein